MKRCRGAATPLLGSGCLEGLAHCPLLGCDRVVEENAVKAGSEVSIPQLGKEACCQLPDRLTLPAPTGLFSQVPSERFPCIVRFADAELTVDPDVRNIGS